MVHLDKPTSRVAVGVRLFALGLFMQMSDHFPIADALRMINLDAPQMALQGDTIQLSCAYSLLAPSDLRLPRDTSREQHATDELIYAIKWYRDEREFFRFLTQDWPHKQAFPDEGLDIDLDKSDNQTVVLRNVSLSTSGIVRCEVSTDAPSFLTKSIERKLLIHHLPNEGPTLDLLDGSDGRRKLHYLGERVAFKCTTPHSKPAAQLDWILDESLNLSNALIGAPLSTSGAPIFQMGMRRVLHRPRSQLKRVEPEPVVETIVDGDAALALGDSLLRVAESTTGWLNLTVDANLLHYLSSLVGELGTTKSALQLPTATHQRATTKPAASRGSAFVVKARRKGDARQRGPASTIAGQFQLRVRCVARLLHLSWSDDIRLQFVNSTSDKNSAADKAHMQWLRIANKSGSHAVAPCLTSFAAALAAHLMLSQFWLKGRLLISGSS